MCLVLSKPLACMLFVSGADLDSSMNIMLPQSDSLIDNAANTALIISLDCMSRGTITLDTLCAVHSCVDFGTQ